MVFSLGQCNVNLGTDAWAAITGGGHVPPPPPPIFFDGPCSKPLNNYCWLCAFFLWSPPPKTLTRNRRRWTKCVEYMICIWTCQCINGKPLHQISLQSYNAVITLHSRMDMGGATGTECNNLRDLGCLFLKLHT